jgi:hypothetical protein
MVFGFGKGKVQTDSLELLARGSVRCLVEFGRRPRRIGQLLVERLPVLDASAQELRPVRHDRLRVSFFREQTPKLRVIPAQTLLSRIAMSPNAGPKPLDL